MDWAINTIFRPQKVEPFTFESALKALDIQRVARISRIALFTFANIAWTTAGILLEVGWSFLPAALPCVLIGLVAFGIFFAINQNDERYIDGLSSSVRTALSVKEVRVLLQIRKTDLVPFSQLEKQFKCVNTLLGYKLFDSSYLSRLHRLWESAEQQQTLVEAARTQHTSLALQFAAGYTDPPRFGWPEKEYSFSVDWDGENADAFDCQLRLNPLRDSD